MVHDQNADLAFSDGGSPSRACNCVWNAPRPRMRFGLEADTSASVSMKRNFKIVSSGRILARTLGIGCGRCRARPRGRPPNHRVVSVPLVVVARDARIRPIRTAELEAELRRPRPQKAPCQIELTDGTVGRDVAGHDHVEAFALPTQPRMEIVQCQNARSVMPQVPVEERVQTDQARRWSARSGRLSGRDVAEVEIRNLEQPVERLIGHRHRSNSFRPGKEGMRRRPGVGRQSRSNSLTPVKPRGSFAAFQAAYPAGPDMESAGDHNAHPLPMGERNRGCCRSDVRLQQLRLRVLRAGRRHVRPSDTGRTIHTPTGYYS